MSVVELTKKDFDKIDFDFDPRGRGRSTKYPWYGKKVGEGFFIPYDSKKNIKTYNYRPNPPPRLKEEGQVWRFRQGYYEKLDAMGLFVRRVK